MGTVAFVQPHNFSRPLSSPSEDGRIISIDGTAGVRELAGLGDDPVSDVGFFIARTVPVVSTEYTIRSPQADVPALTRGGRGSTARDPA